MPGTLRKFSAIDLMTMSSSPNTRSTSRPISLPCLSDDHQGGLFADARRRAAAAAAGEDVAQPHRGNHPRRARGRSTARGRWSARGCEADDLDHGFQRHGEDVAVDLTIRLGRMASVSGSLIVSVVPRPGSLSSSTVPLRSSIFDLTMSMPMPRPDTSVTFSAVLSPGSQISWWICGGGHVLGVRLA